MNPKPHASHLWIASALVMIHTLSGLPLLAQQKAGGPVVPKLIIGIAVDQLRTDYLYALRHRMGNRGFRRLMEQGVVYDLVTFDLDRANTASALAVLATGCYPYENGVPAAMVYDPQMLRRQSIFFDRTCTGVNTTASLSPQALTSTTLADELKVASYRTARIYSLAPEPEQAIISAGHTGDCALWIDDKTGLWASSSYYTGWPSYLTRVNSQTQPLFFNLKEAVWKPLFYSGGHLDIMPYHYETKTFEHSFYQYRQPNVQAFKTSPMVNCAVVELAKLMVRNMLLGQGQYTDMLQLTLYAGSWQHDRPELYGEELQDTYLRLDDSLGDLLDAVDKAVGLQNTFIYLCGTGLTNPMATEEERTLLGQFYPTRCTSLLNSHLIARYGTGQWVSGYDNYQIYLNRNSIEAARLSLHEVQQTAREFVSLFSGVDEVVTAYDLQHNDFSDRIRRTRHSYHRGTGGDLLISLLPGWSVHVDGQEKPQPQERHDIVPGPAIIFAPASIAPQHISQPVEASAIAPTVARLIRIRAPSGCQHAPLGLE